MVIGSKDRPGLLIRAVQQVEREIPYENLFIYEGSEDPDLGLLSWIKEHIRNVTIFPAYGMSFGQFRSDGMSRSKADFVAHIDDDIILSKNWFSLVISRFQDPRVLASQGRLIYGTDDRNPVTKLSRMALRDEGGSGGASIYDRKKVLEIGNFDPRVHRGEDMELKLRTQKAGYLWVKENSAVAFHPVGSVLEFIRRPRGDVVSWDFIMQYSSNRSRFFLERFGSCLIMPFYYGWKTRDLRCFGTWGLFRLVGLVSFLTKKYKKWS